MQAFYLQVGYFLTLKTRTNGFCFTSQYKNVKADVSPLACLAASARSNNMFVRAVPFRSLERHQL